MISTKNFRTATTVVTLIALGALASAVHAAPGADVPSIVVKYDPAAAATNNGATELYLRIARAAVQVCPERSAHSLALNALALQCQHDAVARAVGAVNERHLVEVAAAHTHRG